MMHEPAFGICRRRTNTSEFYPNANSPFLSSLAANFAFFYSVFNSALSFKGIADDHIKP